MCEIMTCPGIINVLNPVVGSSVVSGKRTISKNMLSKKKQKINTTRTCCDEELKKLLSMIPKIDEKMTINCILVESLKMIDEFNEFAMCPEDAENTDFIRNLISSSESLYYCLTTLQQAEEIVELAKILC